MGRALKLTIAAFSRIEVKRGGGATIRHDTEAVQRAVKRKADI
jgi:hypothetical protein